MDQEGAALLSWKTLHESMTVFPKGSWKEHHKQKVLEQTPLENHLCYSFLGLEVLSLQHTH